MFSFSGTISRFSNSVRHFSSKKVGFLGVPFGKGQKDKGVKEKGLELAPDVIRSSSLFKQLVSIVDVKDYGNVNYLAEDDGNNLDSSLVNYNHVVANDRKVSESVHQVINDGRVCLTIGGDHSIFTGSLHGHLQSVGEENLAVVYIDAHADFNVASSSPSGNMHGMCVSMVTRELEQEWTKYQELNWIKHRLPASSLGYIGLRSVDPGEVAMLTKLNVAAYTMMDVVKLGVDRTLAELLSRINPKGDKILHVSIDTDSLDPLFAPSTTLPEPGGLSSRELIYIADMLHRTSRVGAIDWVEFNPLIGSKEDQKNTLDAIRETILSLFGSRSYLVK